METYNEVREIGGKKYEVIKTPCNCMCHKTQGMLHVMACCNNGFVEYLTEIKDEKEKQQYETL